VILFSSVRRDGKSLGQMAREEIGKVGGFTALLTVLLIMIILLAVVALVVVNALRGSPWERLRLLPRCRSQSSWGSICAIGGREKSWSVQVLDSSWILLTFSAGSGFRHSASLAPLFTFSGVALAVAVIVYGFLASALPVWLLLDLATI